MATLQTLQRDNDKGPTNTTISRVTKTGRTLTYSLTVIQQPERARACGSGAKSSADRRPVDPPPVVELRIFEGEGTQGEDITFGYGANFFLFATLEVARPMAHGRVQQTSAPQVPVLTGMPVSGMAYLDRPTEAGYFIFPDLSVRHEGKYILSFNLYEETREGNDDGETESQDKKPSGPCSPDASFDWRLEVKSRLFTVFSAKKFPGLAESTSLSRTVAEQGCRVRIRRDVRMRRRDGKGNNEMDVQEEEYRVGRPVEQDFARERSRSNSGGADEGRAPYQDPNGYRSQSGSPIAAQAPAGPGGYLGPLDRNQFAQPQFAQPQPPPQPYQTAPNNYHPQAPASYRPGPPPPPPTAYAVYDRQHPQSAYPTNPPREQREWEDHRRASVASYQPQHPAPQYPQQNGPHPTVDSNYNRPPFQSYAPRPHSPGAMAVLPPLKMANLDAKFDSMTSPPGPLSSISRIAPPLHSPSYDRSHDRAGTYTQYTAPPLAPAPAPLAAAEPIRSGGKRAYDQVFSSSSTTRPLYNGMRPGSSHGDQTMFDNDDDDDEAEEAFKNDADLLRMSYRRADGSDQSRNLPLMQ